MRCAGISVETSASSRLGSVGDFIRIGAARAFVASPSSERETESVSGLCTGPNYPKDAQGRRPTGSGIVVMEVDNKTGLVKSARMEKARAINFWMTLLFKPSVNGDLSPAVFRESIAP